MELSRAPERPCDPRAQPLFTPGCTGPLGNDRPCARVGDSRLARAVQNAPWYDPREVWGLDNRTPFAADRVWVRDCKGRHHWVVAVKATFHISERGGVSLADEQLPPLHEPEYFGDPGTSSLRYEADLTALKPATDVLVVGSACAPQGKPATSVTVGLRLGALQKTLVVHGDRSFFVGPLGTMTTKPEAFVQKPLRYERAFGGAAGSSIDLRNPVGRGFARTPGDIDGKPAPNVEYPGGDRTTAGPAGFGPLASYWQPRLKLAGTYDAAWVEHQKPLLPNDYDPQHLLSAPTDQRINKYLVGGELVELVGFTSAPALRFSLPTIELDGESRFGRHRRPHPFFLSTVLVEPDEMRLLLTWQTSLEVGPTDVEFLDRTTITAAGIE